MQTQTGPVRPRGYWWVAILALVWNLIGLVFFAAQATLDEAGMAALSEADRQVHLATPGWVYVAFGFAVVGGVLGALCLLLRRRWAVLMFGVSLLALLLQITGIYLVTPAWEAYAFAGLKMPVLLVAIAAALLTYAKHCESLGWLRSTWGVKINCQKCNAQILDSSKFCAACGNQVDRAGNLNVSTSVQRPAAVRVGGWLTLFCILLTVIFPLSSCSGMAEYSDLATKHGVSADSPLYAAIGQNAFGGAIAGIYAFIVGLRIWTGSPNGRRIAITFLVIYPLITFLFNVIALSMLGDAQGSGEIRVALISSILGSFLFSAIWLPYFKWSKRVKATYASGDNVKPDNTLGVSRDG
ncbi:DUF2569 family protein [Pseudoxanthomonas suwonensis]|uniref:DUF2569 family protein n=1 Tax=Pseudoxanthomonas suwonensis TaxID=314722 RepID=UPI0009E25452|nr:DUF2569 family protein [Pseudoxanthomonas suwonensis]